MKNERKLNNAGKISVGVIIAIAVVAVLGLCWIVSGKFSRSMHKTFDSPKKYMAYVEKQAILGKKDNTMRSIYNNLSNQVTTENQAVEEQVTLTIGEAGQSYLRLLKSTGVDLTWLNSAGMKYSVNVKDHDVEMTTALILNEKEIIEPTFILDSKKKAVYAKIPELTKDCIKYDLEKYAEQFDELLAKADKMRIAYPDIKMMDKLADKYVKLVLDGVENVEKDKAELECGDVSQKCTVLRATIKEKDIKSIIKTVCKEATKDEDLKKLYTDMCKAMELENYDEVYDRLKESLTDVAEKIEDREFGLNKVVIELYVDGDGRIVGRNYKIVPEKGEELVVKIGKATKGSNVGFEASVKYGEMTGKLSGTGKLKSGKLSGEYTLKVNGEKVLKVSVEKFDQNAWDDGYLKGHFTCEFEGDLGNLLEEANILPRRVQREIDGYSNMLSSMAGSIEPSLDLIVDTSEKKHLIDIGILNHDEEVFRIAFKGTMKSASKVKIPSKAIDVTESADMKDFVDGLDLDKILDALDNAEVPKEYREMIGSMFKRLR